jgi:hypothetical protein
MKDMKFKFHCHNCGRAIIIKVKDMVPGRSKNCVCGMKINFSGGDGRKVQRSLDKLERSLRRLGKR